jgi:predicted O-methyltransferase YrrM
VRDAAGHERPLHSGISAEEGGCLEQVIASDPTIRRTLEIGCAYGVSSLHICEALRGRPNANHTIVDPLQMDKWGGIGAAQLERAGVDFFDLIAEPSEIALPKLLERSPGRFDLVFVDGWHSFDQVMLDMYYANRLIRNGGYIVVDDCDWASVSTAVSYYLTYPAYRLLDEPHLEPHTWKQHVAHFVRKILPPRIARWLLPEAMFDRIYSRVRYSSMAVLRKIGEDDRSWDYFRGF